MRTIPTTMMLLALWASLAAPVAAADVTIAIDAPFSELALKWNGGQITSYSGVWAVRVDSAGFVMVCGAGQMKDAVSVQATQTWLRSIFIKMNDVKVLKDMSFFAKVKSTTDVRAAQATCRSTKTPAPQGEFSVQMDWPPAQAKF